MGQGGAFGFFVLWGLVLCWEVLWFWIVFGTSAWDWEVLCVLEFWIVFGIRRGIWWVRCLLDCVMDYWGGACVLRV